MGLDPGGGLRIGPERVTPLSLAAVEDPALIRGLARLLSPGRHRPGIPVFYSLVARPAPTDATTTEAQLLAFLQGGTRSLEDIGRHVGWAQVYLSYPNRLEAGGFVQRAGFTPTDSLHVLGTHAPWDCEAALLGARVLGQRLGVTAEVLARLVSEQVADRLATEILAQVADDEPGDSLYLGSRLCSTAAGRPRMDSG